MVARQTLLISVSKVARIIGVRHWYPTSKLIFLKAKAVSLQLYI
jgi:hypothetical protein